MKYETFEIMPEVTKICDNGSNIYVVEGRDLALVIDTGHGFINLRSMVEEITRKPLKVVCTHGHIDHAFGGHYFDGIYMDREDLPVFEAHYKFKAEIAKNPPEGLQISEEDLAEWIEARPEIDYISAGDIFDLGDAQLEVISLKGHTPGSIGLLDRKHRILFSGDGLISHIWMHLDESSTLEEYLEILNSTDGCRQDFDIICSGHNQEPLPVSFINDLKLALTDLIGGAIGKPYNNPVAPGMIYARNGCEVVYSPDKVRKAK